MAKRIYKVRPDSPDLRDYIFISKKFKYPQELPAVVDLRAECSPIVDQGELGSCTANAIASGLREFLLIKAKQVWVALSRLFLYYKERELEGTVAEDSGATIRDGMKVLNKTGVCPEADWPYDISKFADPPSRQAAMDAEPYKIAEYHRILNLTMLKAALAEGQTVVVGFYVYSSFESEAVAATGIVPVPDLEKEDLFGGHAVLAVGYDDVNNRTITRNSWGDKWGDKGYFYLPYEYWNKGLVMDMWTGSAGGIPEKSLARQLFEWFLSLFH